MIETIKNFFKKFYTKKDKSISFKNWEIINYTGSVYNIVELPNDTWIIEMSLFLNPKGEQNVSALILPLNLCFIDYTSAFRFIQNSGPMFMNTLDKVIVVNKEGKSLKPFNLDPKIMHKAMNKILTETTHSGNQTIN